MNPPPIDPTPGDAAASRFAVARGQAAATAREMSNLLTCDEHYLQLHFVRLAVDTLELLPAGTAPAWADMDVRSMGCPVNWGATLDVVPERIRVGWRAWPAMWDGLVWRNPRLRLAAMLAGVGEVTDAQSRPDGMDELLLRWVDCGLRLPLPWPATEADEEDVSTELYADLRETREEIGGWIHYDRETDRRVFRPDPGGTTS